MKSSFSLFLLFNYTLVSGQAGLLDMSFGTNGKVITNFENSTARATALSLQSDGKILLAGSDFSGSDGEELVVVRYLSNGQIDIDYGSEGMFASNNSDFTVYDSEVDEEDNLYVLGAVNNTGENVKTFVAKLTIEGKVDTTFAGDGLWISELPDVDEFYTEIVIQKNGQLLISGIHHNFPAPSTSTVRRINVDGTIDNSFGVNGSASVVVSGGHNTSFLKLNSKEEIFTGGLIVNLMDTDSSRVFLIKYDNKGLLDSLFAQNGIFESESGINERGKCLHIQDDNRILVGTIDANAPGLDFGLIRLNEDGTYDDSFGNNGRVTADFSEDEKASSLSVQEDGKIILSGTVKSNLGYDYSIVRYDLNGILDLSFGEFGMVTTDFGFNDFINASILQSDGKLICAGSSGDNFSPISFSMSRYLTDVISKNESEDQQLDLLSVFPNPTSGIINIEIHLENTTQVFISLYNSAGLMVRKLIDHKIYAPGTYNFDMDLDKDIDEGLYNLKIETVNASITKTIVVHK